jgi:hypothetical protein
VSEHLNYCYYYSRHHRHNSSGRYEALEPQGLAQKGGGLFGICPWAAWVIEILRQIPATLPFQNIASQAFFPKSVLAVALHLYSFSKLWHRF